MLPAFLTWHKLTKPLSEQTCLTSPVFLAKWSAKSSSTSASPLVKSLMPASTTPRVMREAVPSRVSNDHDECKTGTVRNKASRISFVMLATPNGRSDCVRSTPIVIQSPLVAYRARLYILSGRQQYADSQTPFFLAAVSLARSSNLLFRLAGVLGRPSLSLVPADRCRVPLAGPVAVAGAGAVRPAEGDGCSAAGTQ